MWLHPLTQAPPPQPDDEERRTEGQERLHSMTIDELAAEEREARMYLNAVRPAMGSYGQPPNPQPLPSPKKSGASAFGSGVRWSVVISSTEGLERTRSS